ncbi:MULTISPECIES: M23 family metallopeptidase [Mumia]|uniref:Peptidoglycan DD-metalloendopeptidase family protein n=2 Tax=Mumia TaxID=1546255 RepID=A0ABW1QPG7_9ACTN|nr:MULTISPECIES: M23 family metallopeptidase [Mumia]
MTSRPAPKRRAEKPKKGSSRVTEAADATSTTGRRVAGRPASPADETATFSSHTEVSPPLTADPQADTRASSAATSHHARPEHPGRTTSTSRESTAPRSAARQSTPAEPYRGRRAAELPPIPADATATIDAVSDHTTVTERRSGELRAPRRATPPGSRSARTKTRRFPGLPTPAVVGAAALVLAGVGAVAMSSAKPPVMETADFVPVAADAAAGTAESRYDPSNVDVTRDFDRALLDKQAEQQAAQMSSSLAQLANKTEARSKEIKKRQWVIPLTGYRLTARFGQSSSLWSTVHTGLDFAAPSGTRLVAIARGTITSTGYDGAYGNKTVLTLEDGTQLWYCHQSSVTVSVGDAVEPGDLVGYVGSTGNVTGPHLHLEVRPTPDTPIDPLVALREHFVNP